MSYKGIVPHAPRCLSIDKVEEKAIEALQPLIEELEVSAVTEGEWPCEAVHRALLACAVGLIVQSEGPEGAIKTLEEEIKILKQCAG